MTSKELKLGATGVSFVVGIICLLMWGCPHYDVYRQTLAGKAHLAEAESTKQIATTEAHAKMESAKLLAEAEVERAKGVAKANQIIGESLKDNEAYLRYLWIQGLQEGKNEVIYVPTEANLPILEAGNGLRKRQEKP
jgi:regulator of protease activity HflC (stomatin/prohibitin superfamily)